MKAKFFLNLHPLRAPIFVELVREVALPRARHIKIDDKQGAGRRLLLAPLLLPPLHLAVALHDSTVIDRDLTTVGLRSKCPISSACHCCIGSASCMCTHEMHTNPSWSPIPWIQQRQLRGKLRRTLAHSTFSLLRLRSPHSVLRCRCLPGSASMESCNKYLVVPRNLKPLQ